MCDPAQAHVCVCACSSRPLRSTLPWFETFKGCGNTKFSQVANSLHTREATSVLRLFNFSSLLIVLLLLCLFLRVRIRCRLCHPRLFPDTYPTASTSSTICSTGKKCSSQTPGMTLFDRFEPLEARKGSSDRMTGTRNKITTW